MQWHQKKRLVMSATIFQAMSHDQCSAALDVLGVAGEKQLLTWIAKSHPNARKKLHGKHLSLDTDLGPLWALLICRAPPRPCTLYNSDLNMEAPATSQTPIHTSSLLLKL